MLLSPRHLPRVAAMVTLFTRYGLRDFARQQGLLALDAEEREAEREVEEDGDPGIDRRARRFRQRLVELGPAYVKLGQVLSTRPDLLPEAYIRELEHLQDDVPQEPFEAIRALVEEELGARLGHLFEVFDPVALGAASLGQVHAAVLRDGREVVVKVQRPGIRAQLADDLEFFQELARFLTEHTQAGGRVDMIGVVQQLERALADELDYRVEARNAAMLRRSLAELPRILIPRVIEGYTTARVLTTERIRGVKVDEIPPVARLEHDFGALADAVAKAYLKQITIDGHFHADPHPGNLFVVLPRLTNPRTPAEVAAGERRAEPRPAVTTIARLERDAQRDAPPVPADDTGLRIALIDFGMTARLSEAMRDLVVRLLMELADNRGDDAADTLVSMGEPAEGFDRAGYTREIAQLVARNFDLSVGEVEAGRVLFEVINISFRHGLRLPAELTLLAKTFFNLDAVTRALDPSYSPVHAVREFTTRIANERARRDLSPRRLFEVASQASELANVLPRRLDLITKRLADNEMGILVDSPQLGRLISAMQKIANRIFTGLVLTGLLIASAMLHPSRPTLGTAGFVIAAVIGLYMVLSILLGDRRTGRRGGSL